MGSEGGTGTITAGTQLFQLNESNSNQQFDDALDDVRVYNRALSADEIKQLYRLGGGE